MSALKKVFLLAAIITLCLSVFSWSGLPVADNSLCMEKTFLENVRPDIGGRFIPVIRNEGKSWMLILHSAVIYFLRHEIYFLQRISQDAFYQMKLTIQSPDNATLQIVKEHNRLVYKNVMDGVDIEYYVNHNGNLEYDILVYHPLNLENLRFHLSGGEVESGLQHLTWRSPAGDVLEKVLSVHETESQRPVPFSIHQYSKNEYGFRIKGMHSVIFPIRFDPEIVFSTYFSETEEVHLSAITHDASGALYIGGSILLPAVSPSEGLLHRKDAVNMDGCLMKIDPMGESLFLFVVFGGQKGDELPSDIQLSVNEAVYVAGTTTSNDFPVSQNAVQASYKGFGDAFCFVLNAHTEEVLFSSYWGGSKSENLTSLEVQPNGNAVLAGNTNSPDFPTQRPSQAFIRGLFDGFLSVIEIDKKRTEFSTFLGGKNQDSIECMTIMKNGSIFVSGYTFSPDFYTQGVHLSQYKGASDIFVTGFSPTYTITGSNLYGGTNQDYPGDLASYGNTLYFIGTTLSADFPLTTKQSYSGHSTSDVYNGGDIVFISWQDSLLQYAGLFGGSGDDMGVSVSTDSHNNIIITGNTRSEDVFITHDALKKVLDDPLFDIEGLDGLIIRLNPDLTTITYSSYWGGFGDDTILDGCVSGKQLTIIGKTNSENFRTTFGSLQVEKSVETDSFITGFYLDYFYPGAPENVRITTTIEGNLLTWTSSMEGEAPVDYYTLYMTVVDGITHAMIETTSEQIPWEEAEEMSIPSPSFEEDKNYYLYLQAVDKNNKTSSFSNILSVCNNSQEQPPFLIAEYYDPGISEGINQISLDYINNLENKTIQTLHYYPNKSPSTALKSRKRYYNACLNGWCLVNGDIPLTMSDSTEDNRRLSEAISLTTHFMMSLEAISIPNETLNKQVKATIRKTGPYSSANLELTVLLIKKVAPNHWEVIDSGKTVWNHQIVVLAEEMRQITFHTFDIPQIRQMTDVTGYALVGLLQDPNNHRILCTTILPLSEESGEGSQP